MNYVFVLWENKQETFFNETDLVMPSFSSKANDTTSIEVTKEIAYTLFPVVKQFAEENKEVYGKPLSFDVWHTSSTSFFNFPKGF